jgi:hypothetical protein
LYRFFVLGAYSSHIRSEEWFWLMWQAHFSPSGIGFGFGVSWVLLMRICPCLLTGKILLGFFTQFSHDTSLLRRPPLVQTSSKNTTLFVWLTLGMTFIAYSRFISLVIWDITNYLGIACFTVRKKDKNGNWYSAQPNAKQLWYTLYEQEPALLLTLAHSGLIDTIDSTTQFYQLCRVGLSAAWNGIVSSYLLRIIDFRVLAKLKAKPISQL